MNRNLLQIDVSNRQNQIEEDLINIQFINEDALQVNFSKLVSQSKYIRDNYKYTEIIESIQREIDEIESKTNIKERSIRLFFQLIQDEKVTIELDLFKDFYALSQYFSTSKVARVLDEIHDSKLFNDVDFSIQTLADSASAKDMIETNFLSHLEHFLSGKINECFEKVKFGDLPVATIYRVIERSSEEGVNHDLLLDFILSSVETRFILLKFVSLHRLSDDKFDAFVRFIGNQAEDVGEKYLQFVHFDYALMMRMKKTKEELKEEKEKHEETKEELKEEREKHEATKEELKEEREKHEATKEELKEEREKHEVMIKDMSKKRFKQALNMVHRIKSDEQQYAHDIFVAGFNGSGGLGVRSNNANQGHHQIIWPPLKLPLDPSSLKSYSANWNHSVAVTDEGKLVGAGEKSRISRSFSRDASEFTEFCIKDSSGTQLEPISAVCTESGTLFMLIKSNGNGTQLVFHDSEINGCQDVFLEISYQVPVALFGGYYHAAAICDEGEVIFINSDSVRNSPMSRIEAFLLPGGEKASSVACCNDYVFVLSVRGRVFASAVQRASSVLSFSEVSELSEKEIVCLSGTCGHCIAVSKEGCVFARGTNSYGELGLNGGAEKVSSFMKVSSLEGHVIRAAYAGSCFSLFETNEGEILSCGNNFNGQLLLSKGPGDDVCSPVKTTIDGVAKFCIAGYDISAVFVGGSPPPNTPNTQVKWRQEKNV